MKLAGFDSEEQEHAILHWNKEDICKIHALLSMVGTIKCLIAVTDKVRYILCMRIYTLYCIWGGVKLHKITFSVSKRTTSLNNYLIGTVGVQPFNVVGGVI